MKYVGEVRVRHECSSQQSGEVRRTRDHLLTAGNPPHAPQQALSRLPAKRLFAFHSRPPPGRAISPAFLASSLTFFFPCFCGDGNLQNDRSAAACTL